MTIEEALALKKDDSEWMENFTKSDTASRIKKLREVGVAEEYLPSKKRLSEAELDNVAGGSNFPIDAMEQLQERLSAEMDKAAEGSSLPCFDDPQKLEAARREMADDLRKGATSRFMTEVASGSISSVMGALTLTGPKK